MLLECLDIHRRLLSACLSIYKAFHATGHRAAPVLSPDLRCFDILSLILLILPLL